MATLETTRDMWYEAVELAPDRPAVIDGNRRLTYVEANRMVERIAARLAGAVGTAKPKVAVFLPNCLEYYLIYWAVACLGGIIVPLNTWLKSDGLIGIFKNVRPEVLVVRSPVDEAALDAAKKAPPRVIIALDPGQSDLWNWETFLEDVPVPPLTPIESDAPSVIVHTSGTTAVPKGAVMRHCDLIFNVMAAIDAHQFCTGDVHLLVNPMFHCSAVYTSLPVAAYTKTPIVIASPTRPERLLEIVQSERVTTFMSVPPVFHQLLKIKDLTAYDASCLRLMAYAGSPMQISTIRKLRRYFPGIELHNFFGLTETTSITHVLSDKEADERPESIGRLLPCVEARIVDENGRELPPGEVGELIFARKNVVTGYYNQPGRLEESIITHDGREWFRTDDLAMVDDEGYFYIKGRKRDMIIVGGENVYAVEVESLLMTHEKVREAAVRGVPATGAMAFLGEQIKAYVVPADETLTKMELRRYCYEKLPSYKVPQQVVFMDALPRNPSGKVVKSQLP